MWGMCKERSHETNEYVPITVCPDCVQTGLQPDPRTKNPAYPVIESTCSTHRIAKGEFAGVLSHPTEPLEGDKI